MIRSNNNTTSYNNNSNRIRGLEKDVAYSFLVVGWINFLGNCARGVILPVLWPLCEELGGNYKDLAYLIAIFSGGRLISHIPYGIIADRCRHRRTLLLSGVIFAFGAFLLAKTELSNQLRMLYIAQLLMGIGTGSLGVARSYVVELTEEGSERTTCLAHLQSVKYIGFAVTPFIGSLAVIVGRKINQNSHNYSFPGNLLFFFAFLWILFLIYPFKEIEETETGKRLARERQARQEQLYHDIEQQSEITFLITHQDEEEGEEVKQQQQRPSPNYQSFQEFRQQQVESARLDEEQWELTYAYILVITFNCLFKGAMAVYETQLARLLIHDFHFDHYHVGLIVSACGIIGAVQLLYFETIYESHWTSYQLIYGSTVVMIVGQLLILLSNFSLYTQTFPFDTRFQDRREYQMQELSLVAAVSLVYAFVYPIGCTSITAKYANLQEYGKQGLLQSLMSVSSSLSRIFGAILSTRVLDYRHTNYKELDKYYHIHNQSLAGCVLFCMSILLFLLINYRERIIEYGGERERMKASENFRFNVRCNRIMLIGTMLCFSVSIFTMFY
jgi:MFS family permease